MIFGRGARSAAAQSSRSRHQRQRLQHSTGGFPGRRKLAGVRADVRRAFVFARLEEKGRMGSRETTATWCWAVLILLCMCSD